MLVSFLSHLLGAWFAFALPCYSTYKALAHTPSTDTLHALATYWAVIGAFLAFEQTLGLVLSWLPFYWELRTLFLLYVSLPQTEGSAYVYKNFLQPWLSSNEADFDVAVASAQTNAIDICRSRIAALFDLVWSALNKTIPSTQSGDVQKPPDPLAASAGRLKDLWSTYAPSVLATLVPKDTAGAHVSATPPEHVHQPY